ncbi:hypothetical protein GGR57DRAFT_497543 [Xylariaceae sp. FL1272]|nr:hypothetical protein GGR57DRAFT_497543 [Xylariaceae sp. FL1272]
MKPTTIVSSCLLAGAVTAKPIFTPMTKIAGVEVIDTQIVRDAQKLIQGFPDYLFSHQMRSWLFGAAMINNNATLRHSIDLEVHAVATMLHDLGWDQAMISDLSYIKKQTPGSRWVSNDKRFEVDGAIGARTWLSEHPIGKYWSADRVRKVFQAIALHGSTSIVEYFELEEAVIVASIGLDYQGADNGKVPVDVYNNIATHYPQDELLSGTNDTFVWICQTKPAVTYDTWLQPFGDAYIPGYSAVGYRTFDAITGGSANKTFKMPG